jgi:CRISPR system Cascade subunit CasE
MYLSRLFLNPAERSVRLDVANPDGLHKTVMRLFPMNAGPEARKVHGVLHRLDESAGGQLMLLVQSRAKPDPALLLPGYLRNVVQDPELAFAGVTENPSIRNVAEERQAIGVGDRFLFRLKANTTKKIGTKSGSDGRRIHGQRVPVRGDEARLEWLGRHAERAGFAFSDVHVREVQARGQNVRVAGVIFDGVLEVADPTAFRAALEAGIGPAKAYGFGLLSISHLRKLV